MSKHGLIAHPQFPCPAIREMRVDYNNRDGGVELTYELYGEMARLCIPARKTTPRSLDELWKQTCFECFLSLEGERYLEMNFSPSGDWAAYGFSRYRELAEKINLRPVIDVYQGADELEVRVFMKDFPYSFPNAFQLCAVLTDKDGQFSYWAIKHPEGKPDFHARSAWTRLT